MKRAGGAALVFLLLLAGCATPQTRTGPRPFKFGEDTFAFANELKWEYGRDQQGRWRTTPRDPPPDYALRCFVLTRSVAQFFRNARFDVSLAVADAETYRRLIRQVVRTNPRKPLPDEKKIVIPGYPHLHAFSQAYEHLLKDECGSAVESYFQRGHWRMIMPFTRRGQEEVAQSLVESCARNLAPVIHVSCFPSLSINHAFVVYAAAPQPDTIVYSLYDPNRPQLAETLTFERTNRSFYLGPNLYFKGGWVDVYEVYHRWNY